MLRWILTFMITSMLFFPEKDFHDQPENYGLSYEDVWIQTEDGVKFHGWFLSTVGATRRVARTDDFPILKQKGAIHASSHRTSYFSSDRRGM